MKNFIKGILTLVLGAMIIGIILCYNYCQKGAREAYAFQSLSDSLFYN